MSHFETKDVAERLEAIVRLLAQRYGTGVSIGTVLARVCAMNLRHQGLPVSASTVAARTGLPRQSLSRLAQYLEAQGHARIIPDPTDERRKLLEPTDPEEADRFLEELARILLP